MNMAHFGGKSANYMISTEEKPAIAHLALQRGFKTRSKQIVLSTCQAFCQDVGVYIGFDTWKVFAPLQASVLGPFFACKKTHVVTQGF